MLRFFWMMIVRKLGTLAVLGSLLAGVCLGFDTGHHHDLTRAVLIERGFGEDAVKAIQVENWLTDYFSNSPTYPKQHRQILEKLHFDNLFTTDQVDRYWAVLMNNLKASTEKAARDHDVETMIATIGVGLHAVQDFYSHSNWVEAHPRPLGGPYRTDTYFSPRNGMPQVIYSGKYPAARTSGPGDYEVPPNAALHGDYFEGLNHDAPDRPRWDEAYVFAYCATHELVAVFEQWAESARPGSWAELQKYTAPGEEKKRLDNDVTASRNISMWIKADDQDGHWKGKYSGSSRFFSAYSSKWVGGESSIYVRAIREHKLPDALTEGLYSAMKTPVMPEVPRFSLKRRAVIVRVTRVAEIKDGGLLAKLPKMGGSDFYSRMTIGGQEFWGRALQASREFDDPWTEMRFVDAAEIAVPIKMSVFDEDSIDGKLDQLVDINPLPKERAVSFLYRFSDSMLTGDINGVFDSAARQFTLQGLKPDDRRAVVTAYISSNILN